MWMGETEWHHKGGGRENSYLSISCRQWPDFKFAIYLLNICYVRSLQYSERPLNVWGSTLQLCFHMTVLVLIKRVNTYQDYRYVPSGSTGVLSTDRQQFIVPSIQTCTSWHTASLYTLYVSILLVKLKSKTKKPQSCYWRILHMQHFRGRGNSS